MLTKEREEPNYVLYKQIDYIAQQVNFLSNLTLKAYYNSNIVTHGVRPISLAGRAAQKGGCVTCSGRNARTAKTSLLACEEHAGSSKQRCLGLTVWSRHLFTLRDIQLQVFCISSAYATRFAARRGSNGDSRARRRLATRVFGFHG